MADESGYTRRTFVAGALAGLAGCSTGSEEETTSPESNYTETSEDSPTGEKDTNDTETGGGSDSESSIVYGEDEVHGGEEFYEGSLDENNFYWIELEHPSSQTQNIAEQNVMMTESSDFNYVEMMLTENKTSVDGNPNNTVPLDTVYIAFPGEESDVDSQLVFTGLVESEYDEGGGYGQSNGLYTVIADNANLEEIEGFIDEQVTGYSDLSDNLPDEYQDLIAE